MLPWVYGFSWQAGNVIFLTIFYSVVAVIFGTFAVAVVRALRDVKLGHIEAIRWHVDFNDLPDMAKICRDGFTSGTEAHVCRNGFDCRTCEWRENACPAGNDSSPNRADANHDPIKAKLFGFDMPSDRLYHRGHTWVKREADGMLKIGIDDFGRRMLGASYSPELPKIGAVLSVNGTGWHFVNGGSRVRILSPVDGKVTAVVGTNDGFYLQVDPGDDCDLRHLLKGSEIRPWIMRELERLEMILSTENTGISLADGGEITDNPRSDYPDADWESVTSGIFLEA